MGEGFREGRMISAKNAAARDLAGMGLGQSGSPVGGMAVGVMDGLGGGMRGMAGMGGGSGTSGFRNGPAMTYVFNDDAVYGPIVGNTVAVCRAGRHAYGYSTHTDRWDVVDLGDDSGKWPVVLGNFITVTSNKGLYIFNASTGKWDGVDLSDDKAEDRSAKSRR